MRYTPLVPCGTVADIVLWWRRIAESRTTSSVLQLHAFILPWVRIQLLKVPGLIIFSRLTMNVTTNRTAYCTVHPTLRRKTAPTAHASDDQERPAFFRYDRGLRDDFPFTQPLTPMSHTSQPKRLFTIKGLSNATCTTCVPPLPTGGEAFHSSQDYRSILTGMLSRSLTLVYKAKNISIEVTPVFIDACAKASKLTALNHSSVALRNK